MVCGDGEVRGGGRNGYGRLSDYGTLLRVQWFRLVDEYVNGNVHDCIPLHHDDETHGRISAQSY